MSLENFMPWDFSWRIKRAEAMDMMDEITMRTYRNKEFFYVDYTGLHGNKERTIQLIIESGQEYRKKPLKSVLALVNVGNARFDTEILRIFIENQDKSVPYEKRVAVIGLDTLKRVAYNLIVGTNKDVFIKAFESEEEAKEWLVQD
jgi:hypothetical protein